MYTATIIRIIEHRQNTGWYSVVFSINNIAAESRHMPKSDILSRFNLTQGQLLDYCNK